jgi:hypothetical protein
MIKLSLLQVPARLDTYFRVKPTAMAQGFMVSSRYEEFAQLNRRLDKDGSALYVGPFGKRQSHWLFEPLILSKPLFPWFFGFD